MFRFAMKKMQNTNATCIKLITPTKSTMYCSSISSSQIATYCKLQVGMWSVHLPQERVARALKDLEDMDEVLQLDLVLAFGFVPASENICRTYSIYKSVHKIRCWRSSFAWYVIVFSLFFPSAHG